MDTPDTIPVLPVMVATAVLPLLHTPPAGLSLNVVLPFTHNDVLPVIAAGNALTVKDVYTMHPVVSI